MCNTYPCVIMFQSLNGKYYVSVVEDVSIYEGVSMGIVERLIRNSDPKIYEDEYTCWLESWKLHGKMGNVGVPKRLMPVLIHGDGNTNVDELIKDCNYSSSTDIEFGIEKFIDWYKK